MKKKSNIKEFYIPEEYLNKEYWKAKIRELLSDVKDKTGIVTKLAEHDTYFKTVPGYQVGLRIAKHEQGHYENLVRFYNALQKVVLSEKEIEKKLKRHKLSKAS